MQCYLMYWPVYLLNGRVVHRRHELKLLNTSVVPASITNYPIIRISYRTLQFDPVGEWKVIVCIKKSKSMKIINKPTSCSFSRWPIIVKLSPSSLRWAAVSITLVPGNVSLICLIAVLLCFIAPLFILRLFGCPLYAACVLLISLVRFFRLRPTLDSFFDALALCGGDIDDFGLRPGFFEPILFK